MPDRIPWSSLEFFSFCRTTKNEEENSIWCSRSDWIRINLTTSNHGLKIAQTRSFWPPPPLLHVHPPLPVLLSPTFLNDVCMQPCSQLDSSTTRGGRVWRRKRKKNWESEDEKATSWKIQRIFIGPKVTRSDQSLWGRQFDFRTKKGLGEMERARPRRGRWFGRARSCQKSTKNSKLDATWRDRLSHLSLLRRGRRSFPEFVETWNFGKTSFRK